MSATSKPRVVIAGQKPPPYGGQDIMIARQLPDGLRQRWFTLDLQRLQAGDDPHAAMAFACARVAFHVRCAWLLGWVDEALHQQILHLNACRARDCFDSWQAFGQAYARGRSQWLAIRALHRNRQNIRRLPNDGHHRKAGKPRGSGMRRCFSVSRSRMVIVRSFSVSPSMVKQNGVPASSCRR